MIAVPDDIPLEKLLPEKPVLLMGAGPVPIPAEVAKASSIIMSHIGENMKRVIERVQVMAQYTFQTNSKKIIGISGPSSAAMEMAVTSLLWPGRKVLVLNLGVFSNRFAELGRGVGADVTELFPKPLEAFHLEEIKTALKNNSYDVLTIVQGETSCGIKNVELKDIVKLAKDHKVQTIVDSVCTLSTMPLPMDEWGIDVVITGGQKGLSCIPGISLIAYSEEIFEFVEKRTHTMPHWCLDPRRAYKFWGKNEYHYTAPVPGIMAIHEALRLICKERLENRFKRHEECSLELQRGIESLGLELFAPKHCRLNSVVSVKLKGNLEAKSLMKHLLDEHQIEISGAFGLPIFRIGQMGEQCRPENVQRVLVALEKSLKFFGTT